MSVNLFGEENTSIVQVKNQKSIQNKKQKEFNKLCKEIEEIKAETDKVKLDLENANQFYNLNVAPLLLAYDKILFELIQVVDKQNLAFKFTDTFNAKVFEVISTILEEISMHYMDNKDFDALMLKYTDKTAKEHGEEMIGDAKEHLEFMLKSMGINIDLNDIDDSPEGMRKMQELVKEQLEAKGAKKSNRKKSDKQLEKAKAKKDLEDIQSKSIRSIYVSLAKALHPDLEPNEDEKLYKQELLKKVTEAYERKDLAALLSYEMQWVKNESRHSDTLSDEQLTIYNALLKDTKQSLLEELHFVVGNPKYNNFREYVLDTPDYKTGIMEDALVCESKKTELINVKNSLEENNKSLKPFKKFIGEYYDDLYNDFPF